MEKDNIQAYEELNKFKIEVAKILEPNLAKMLEPNYNYDYYNKERENKNEKE